MARPRAAGARAAGRGTRVRDLLDVTRITRGKVELRRERVDLAALLLRTAEDHLPLARDEAHGGRIWAESVPGSGSTFSVAIPVATGAPAPEPSRAPAADR